MKKRKRNESAFYERYEQIFDTKSRENKRKRREYIKM
jgi:hypothetical protein